MTDIRLNFLYGAKNDYIPAKTLASVNGEIKVVSDYDIGFTFYHSCISHTDDLGLVADTISKYASAGWFRVNGMPSQQVINNPQKPVQRLKVNFPPIKSHFWSLDIDGWVVDKTISSKHNWQLGDVGSTANVIRDLLFKNGFSSLGAADFIFLLTSSQLGTESLNCHLYFLFEKAKTDTDMRSVALGVNKKLNYKLLDTAPYKSVQPDFISPPKLKNIQDPIPPGCRISYSPGIYKYVPESGWNKDLSLITPVDWFRSPTSNLVEAISGNWLSTVQKYVGTADRGINEPAYRAAAQMVCELGRSTVLSNINEHAKNLYDACWAAITRHDVRGDAKDRSTYTISTFRQYLQSATAPTKDFGDAVDKDAGVVHTAINDAVAGRVSAVTKREVLQACVNLAARYPTVWLQVKARIKKDLRGIITFGDFEKLVKSHSRSGGGGSLAEIMPEGLTPNENNLIRPMLDSCRYFKTGDGAVYVEIPREDGDDKLLKFDSSLANVFYAEGFRKTKLITDRFGRKCLAILGSDLVAGGKDSVVFEDTLMGGRTIITGSTIGDDTWYNFGEQADGCKMCAKITPKGVTYFNHKDAPVKWENDVSSTCLPDSGNLELLFGGDENKLIAHYRSTVSKYILCDDEDIPALTSWLVASITCKPLAYIAEFVGPPGCGKSTAADLAKDLIDPVSSPHLWGGRSVFTKADSDFFANLDSQLVTIIDNVDTLAPRAQDVLCQVSTGLKYNERILYVQQQMSRYIQKPVIVTGLSKVITRPDLASRTINIQFTNKPPFNGKFMDNWSINKPYYLLAILLITHKSMEILLRTKGLGGINQRDMLIGAVEGVLNGVDDVVLGGIERASKARALDMFDTTNFLPMMFGMLQSIEEDRIEITTKDALEKLKSWVDLNIGTAVDIKLYTDDNNVEVFRERVTKRNIPESPAGMGIQMNKYRDVIDMFSGWKMAGVRRTHKGMTRRYERVLHLTSIL